MKPIFTRGLPDREGASASYLIFDGLASRIYSSLPFGQRDDGFIAVPAAVVDGCTDIVRGAYPENQVGSAVRLTFSFIFSAQAMSVVRNALKLAQGPGPRPAGELRSEAIQSGFAEELLRARELKSPLGKARVRTDLVPP